MPAGDLVVKDGQYEFNGILFNDVADGNAVKVISVKGLFDLPDVKSTETDLADDHGGTLSRPLFNMRRMVMEFVVLSTTKTLMYTKTKAITAAFQPSSLLLPLYYQRAFIGKQFINVRAAKFSGFDSSWEKELGMSTATAMFVAPDPRKLAAVQSSLAITIAASGTVQSGTVNMIGDFVGGAKPILEIAGPVTNPRIVNAADEGRTLRLDLVINAGQTLILDFAKRTATIAGVDQSATIRTDNQWWQLNPGNNLITFTRSNAPATAATLTVKWWNSYA